MKKLSLIVGLLLLSVVLAGSVQARTLVKTLGVAPWLGELNSQGDLANRFSRERDNIVSYIIYDLEKSKGWQISHGQAEQMAEQMERQAKEATRISIPDGTYFLSMGWKSKTGRIMRTANPVLKIGRQTYGFAVSAETESCRVEYVFLVDCGNMCLKSAEKIREEIPSVSTYTKCPPCPPVQVHHPPPQIYWRPGGCCSSPRVYYHPPVYYNPRPVYRSRPTTVRTRPAVRPPTVRTRSAVRPPTVRTVSPGANAPGTRTR